MANDLNWQKRFVVLNFFRNFFRSPPEPKQVVTTEPFGLGRFDPDSEDWIFAWNGLRLNLPYEKSAEPKSDVVACADGVTKDFARFAQLIEDEKVKYVRKFPAYGQEVSALVAEDLCFIRGKSGFLVAVCFAGDNDSRYWRIEFDEHGHCGYGLGFDS